MEILSFSVRVVKAETAKKLRPPAAPSLAGQRDEAGFICSAVPPGFRPYTRSRAALKRRNGAHRPVLVERAVRSGRPLRSELRHIPAWKPFQPVKLLSLPWVYAYSLRRCVSRYSGFITTSHLITFFPALQAGKPFLRKFFGFACYSVPDMI